MSNPIFSMDAVSDILSRLPVKSLLRFKCVSKGWYSFIEDPYFVKLHLKQSMESRNHLNVIMKNEFVGELYSVDFDSINFHNFKVMKPLICTSVDRGIEGIASCNGLLCLIDPNYRVIELCNISTRDYIVIRDDSIRIRSTKGTISCYYGFGYDSINDDYKIVRVAQTSNLYDLNEVRIYSLEAKAWRDGKAIAYFFTGRSITGIFVCGALHWVAFKNWTGTWGQHSIVAFDVATEKYREMEPVDDIEPKTYRWGLSALRGCLCTIATCVDCTVKIWMMADYGVKESWTLLYTFQGLSLLRPLAYAMTGDRLLLHQVGNSLLWYDTKENRLEKVHLPQLKNISVSLAAICGENLLQIGSPFKA